MGSSLEKFCHLKSSTYNGVLTSAEAADSKGKYFETMENPANNNKGNKILSALGVLTESKTT